MLTVQQKRKNCSSETIHNTYNSKLPEDNGVGCHARPIRVRAMVQAQCVC
jgi:hypothetical protein